jgi:hypothetical protein
VNKVAEGVDRMCAGWVWEGAFVSTLPLPNVWDGLLLVLAVLLLVCPFICEFICPFLCPLICECCERGSAIASRGGLRGGWTVGGAGMGGDDCGV